MPQMASVEITLPSASAANTMTADTGNTRQSQAGHSVADKLLVELQHDGAAHDDQRKHEQRPSVEVQPEHRVPVSAEPGAMFRRICRTDTTPPATAPRIARP